MKQSALKLRRYTLVLLFVVACVAVAAAFALEVLARDPGGALHGAALSLAAAGGLVLSCIGWRLASFRARVFTLLRQLVAGNYEVGLATPGWWRDEVTAIETLLNKLVDQLRTYDELRTRRIRQLRRTLDLVIEHAEEPVMLLDVEKDTLECNAAMCGVLGTEKRSLSLEGLRNLEANSTFIDLIARAVDGEKAPQHGRVAVQLPAQDAPRELDLRVIPLKDKEAAVSYAVLFGKPV